MSKLEFEPSLERNFDNAILKYPFLCEIVCSSKIQPLDPKHGIEDIEAKYRNQDSEIFESFKNKILDIRSALIGGQGIGDIVEEYHRRRLVENSSLTTAIMVDITIFEKLARMVDKDLRYLTQMDLDYDYRLYDSYEKIKKLTASEEKISGGINITTLVQSLGITPRLAELAFIPLGIIKFLDPTELFIGWGTHQELRKKVLEIRAQLHPGLKIESEIAIELKCSSALVRLVAKDRLLLQTQSAEAKNRFKENISREIEAFNISAFQLWQIPKIAAELKKTTPPSTIATDFNVHENLVNFIHQQCVRGFEDFEEMSKIFSSAPETKATALMEHLKSMRPDLHEFVKKYVEQVIEIRETEKEMYEGESKQIALLYAITEKLDAKQTDETIMAELKVERSVVEQAINFISIDRDIRHESSDTQFTGEPFDSVRDMIVNIREYQRNVSESVATLLPSTAETKIIKIKKRPVVELLQLPTPVNEYSTLLRHDRDRALDTAAMIHNMGTRFASSAHLDGLFSELMRAPSRDAAHEFFKAIFLENPTREEKIHQGTLQNLYNRASLAIREKINELLFAGKPFPGQNFALQLLCSNDSQSFIGLFQSHLNKGTNAGTLDALDFVVSFPGFLPKYYSRIYLTETGYRELMSLLNAIKGVQEEHLQKFNHLNPNSIRSPFKERIQNFAIILNTQATLLATVFINSTTTSTRLLNPWNYFISQTGRDRLLKYFLQDAEGSGFDIIRQLCSFRQGSKYLYICHEILIQLLLGTSHFSPDMPLWQSMGVLGEYPANEPGITPAMRLNEIEPRQRKIVEKIIKAISEEIQRRKNLAECSHEASYVAVDLEDSSEYDVVRGSSLAGGELNSEAKILVVDMTDLAESKETKLETFDGLEGSFISAEEKAPLTSAPASALLPDFNLMPMFLNLAVCMVHHFIQKSCFNAGEKLPLTYPEHFFSEIQKWEEEYCFLFVLAISCVELPIASPLTFYCKQELLIRLVTFLKNDDLMTFVMQKFQLQANLAKRYFDADTFYKDAHKVFLLQTIAWSAAKKTLPFGFEKMPYVDFAFSPTARKQKMEDFCRIHCLIEQLYQISQQPRELKDVHVPAEDGIAPAHINKIAALLKALEKIPFGLESLWGANLKSFNSADTDKLNYDEWNIAPMYLLVFMPDKLHGKHAVHENEYGPSYELLKNALEGCFKNSDSNLPRSTIQRRAVLLFTLLQFPPKTGTSGTEKRYSRLCREISQFFIEYFPETEVLEAAEWLLFNHKEFINDGRQSDRIEAHIFFSCLFHNKKFLHYLDQLKTDTQRHARFDQFRAGCQLKLLNSLSEPLFNQVFYGTSKEYGSLAADLDYKIEIADEKNLVFPIRDKAALTFDAFYFYVSRLALFAPETLKQKRSEICMRLVKIVEAGYNDNPTALVYFFGVIRAGNLLEIFVKMDLKDYPAVREFQTSILPFCRKYSTEMHDDTKSKLYAHFVLFRGVLEWLLKNYNDEQRTLMGAERIVKVSLWLDSFTPRKMQKKESPIVAFGRSWQEETLPLWAFTRAWLVRDFQTFTSQQLAVCIDAQSKIPTFKHFMTNLAFNLLTVEEIKAVHSTEGFFGSESKFEVTFRDCRATFFILASGISVAEVYYKLGLQLNITSTKLKQFFQRIYKVFDHADQLLQEENTFDENTVLKLDALRKEILKFFADVSAGLNCAVHEAQPQEFFKLKAKAVTEAKLAHERKKAGAIGKGKDDLEIKEKQFFCNAKEQTGFIIGEQCKRDEKGRKHKNGEKAEKGLVFRQQLIEAIRDLFLQKTNYRFLMYFLEISSGFELSFIQMHPDIFRSIFVALIKSGWEIPEHQWPLQEKQLINIIKFCYKTPHYQKYFDKISLFQDVDKLAPENFIDFMSRVFNVQLDTETLQSLDGRALLRAAAQLNVIINTCNDLKPLQETKEIKIPAQPSLLSRLFGSKSSEPVEEKESKKLIQKYILSDQRIECFLMAEEEYALEYAGIPGNEICGLLNSRAAKIAKEFQAKLSVPLRGGEVFQGIALRILLVLNNEKLTEAKINQIVTHLLTYLWAPPQKKYFHFVNKLDHYLRMRLSASVQRGSLNARQTLLSLLMPAPEPLITAPSAEPPAEPLRLSIPPKLTAASKMKIIQLFDPAEAKEEKGIKISGLTRVMRHETESLARVQSQMLITQQQVLEDGRQHHYQNPLAPELSNYLNIISQEGWECIEPVVESLIRTISESKICSLQSPFAGKPLNDKNISSAFQDLFARISITMENEEVLASTDIHFSTALAVILLRVVQAYRPPFSLLPTMAERRIAALAVKNLNAQLQNLIEETAVIVPVVEQYPAWRDYFQTVVWLMKTIDPAAFAPKSKREPFDILQAVLTVLESRMEAQSFKYIYQFLVNYDLLVPQEIEHVAAQNKIADAKKSKEEMEIELLVIGNENSDCEDQKYFPALLPSQFAEAKLAIAKAFKPIRRGIYSAFEDYLNTEIKLDDSQPLMAIILHAYPALRILKDAPMEYPGPQPSQESLFNQYVFALAFYNPNRFLSYFSAQKWRKAVNDSAYGRQDSGIRLVRNFDRHCRRLATCELQRLLFDGMCAVFNLTITADSKFILNKDSRWTPEYRLVLLELWSTYLQTDFPDLEKIQRIQSLKPVPENISQEQWVKHFSGFLQILLPDMHAAIDDLQNALMHYPDPYRQGQSMRAMTWAIVRRIPSNGVNNLSQALVSHQLNGQLAGLTLRDKRVIQLLFLFNKQTAHTQELAEILEIKTSPTDEVIADIVNGHQQRSPRLNYDALYDKLDDLFFGVSLQYGILAAEDVREIRLAPQPGHLPLAFSRMAQILLSLLGNSHYLDPRQIPLRIYSQAETILVRQESHPHPETLANEIQDFYAQYLVDDQIKNYIGVIKNLGLKKSREPAPLSTIKQTVANAKDIFSLVDELSEKTHLYLAPAYDQKFAELISRNAMIITNNNHVYSKKGSISFMDRGGIPEVKSLTLVKDRRNQHIINKIHSRTQTPRNSYERHFYQSISLAFARRMEEIVTPTFGNPEDMFITSEEKTKQVRFMLIDSEAMTKQVRLMETFIRALHPQLDSKYTHQPVALSFSERGYRSLNEIKNKVIFSVWVQIAWIFNFYTSNKRKLPEFIKSSHFINLVKRLIASETPQAFDRNKLLNQYLLDLKNNNPDLDDDCRRALFKVERLYWRAHPWGTLESKRDGFLKHSCLLFCADNRDDTADLDRDLFEEFSGKISYIHRRGFETIEPFAGTIKVDDACRILFHIFRNFLVDINLETEYFNLYTEKGLRLICSSLVYLPSRDISWNVATYILNAFDSEDKKTERRNTPFQGFITAFKRVLEADHISEDVQKMLRNAFLIFIKAWFDRVEVDPALVSNFNKLTKLRGDMESAIALNNTDRIKRKIKLLLIQLRRDNQTQIPDITKQNIIDLLEASRDVLESGARVSKNALGEICVQIDNAVQEEIYQATLKQRQELITGFKEILVSSGISVSKISDSAVWEEILGSDMVSSLESLQAIFMRWKNIYTLLGLTQEESKFEKTIVQYIPSFDLKNYVKENSRVKNEFRELLCKNLNARHFLDSNFIGVANGEGEIVSKFLNFYLTNGNELIDEGMQTNLLLEFVRANVIDEPLFKNAMRFIFSVLNPVDAVKTSQAPHLREWRANFMEILFLHWNKLAREEMISCFDNPQRFKTFSENLLARMRIAYAAFAENYEANLIPSHFPGSLVELYHLVKLNMNPEDAEMLATLEGLMLAKMPGFQQSVDDSKEIKSAPLPPASPELAIAGTCVITNTLGALQANALPNFFTSSMSRLLQTPDAKMPLQRLSEGKSFSEDQDGFSLSELVEAVVLAAHAPLSSFCSAALRGANEYTRREVIRTIIETLDRLDDSRIPRERTIAALMQSLLRTSEMKLITKPIALIEKMEFPEFKNHAIWYSKFRWLTKLLNVPGDFIFDFSTGFNWQAIGISWEGCDLALMAAIERRYMELLVTQRQIVKSAVVRELPVDFCDLEAGEDVTLVGLMSQWEDISVVAYTTDDGETIQRKLFVNYDKFGAFLHKFFADTNKSKLEHAGYFALSDIIAETKAQKISQTDSPRRLLDNILLRTDLQKYFLHKLAITCQLARIKPVTHYLLESKQSVIEPKHLLEMGWNALAGELIGGPSESKHLYQVDDKELRRLADKDLLLIEHLIQFREKINSAFASDHFSMEQVHCLRDFLVIFKDVFAQNQQSCFMLYQHLVNWAIRQWSKQKNTTELIAVIRLANTARLKVEELNDWVRYTLDSSAAKGFTFPEERRLELLPALEKHEPSFTPWTLIEDYLISRPTKKTEPFDVLRLIDQSLQEHKQAAIDFFEDPIFDRDAYNATSFIACVLRKIGMDTRKKLVKFSDMLGKDSLQNQLIFYIKSLLKNEDVRLEGFMSLLLGMRIELVDHTPNDEEQKRVIEQKCIYVIKKSKGPYKLGISVLRNQKYRDQETGQYRYQYCYEEWSLKLAELELRNISQSDLGSDNTLRQAILTYAGEVCGSESLGALEAWPSTQPGQEHSRRFCLDDIPRPSGNIAAMITGVANKNYVLYLVDNFEYKDCKAQPGSSYLMLAGEIKVKNAIIIDQFHQAYLIRMGKIIQQDEKPLVVKGINLSTLGVVVFNNKFLKIDAPTAAVYGIIDEVTKKAGRTFSPNLEIVKKGEEKSALISQNEYQQRLLTPGEIEWYDPQLPFAIAHRLFKSFSQLAKLVDPNLVDQLQYLNEKSWSNPLSACIALRGYQTFTNKGSKILSGEGDWKVKFERMINLVEEILEIQIIQSPDCQNIIESPEYEKLMVEIFAGGIGKFSEYVLAQRLILPPRVDLVETNYRIDLGIMIEICNDGAVTEKNFYSHCQALLVKLSELTTPSLVEISSDDQKKEDPAAFKMQNKLSFVRQLPQGEELERYSGFYLLHGADQPPEFKFEGQRENYMVELANLQYVDEKEVLHKLYCFPDADFNSVLQEVLLTSGFDLWLAAVPPEMKVSEITVLAKEIYDAQKQTPVLIKQQVFKMLFGKPVEEPSNYYLYGNSAGLEKLTKTNSSVALGLTFPPVGHPQKQINSPAFSGTYREIIGKKAHYLEKGQIRSRSELKPEQWQKFSFPGTGGRLTSLPPSQMPEIVLLDTFPEAGQLGRYKNKIIMASTDFLPKFRLSCQRYTNDSAVLRSNLYAVYKGRLVGVRVPGHGAEFFNQKLAKFLKNRTAQELTLTQSQVDELINRWKADAIKCAQAGNFFYLYDNMFKFLQGGNKPKEITSVQLGIVTPDPAPVPRLAESDAVETKSSETKEIKNFDGLEEQLFDHPFVPLDDVDSVELKALPPHRDEVHEALISTTRRGSSIYQRIPDDEEEAEQEEFTAEPEDPADDIDIDAELENMSFKSLTT